jgi:hypothetical protein
VRRLRVSLAMAVCVALVGVALTAATVHAQTPPADAPLDPTKLITNPAEFATELFNMALIAVGRESTSRLAVLVESLLSNGLIGNTPAELSYGNKAVQDLWDKVRFVANGGLAVVTVWGGVNFMLGPHIRAPYHGALELVPRVLVGALLVNSSLDWGRFVIDVNNGMCAWVGGVPWPPPGWQGFQEAGASEFLVHLIAAGIYLVMGLLLGAQMLMRLALVDSLLVLAPVALLCWVLPQTQSWARLWLTTFFGTVFVQFVQVLVLRLGTDLTASLVTLVPDVAGNPFGVAPTWLATLALGVAVLQLTRKIPRLMPGYPGAGDAWSPMRLFTVRQVASVLGGERGRTRRGS